MPIRKALLLCTVFSLLGVVSSSALAYKVEPTSTDMNTRDMTAILGKCGIPNNPDPDTKFVCDCVRAGSSSLFDSVNKSDGRPPAIQRDAFSVMIRDCQKQLADAKAAQASQYNAGQDQQQGGQQGQQQGQPQQQPYQYQQ